jgi:hypothetical protein
MWNALAVAAAVEAGLDRQPLLPDRAVVVEQEVFLILAGLKLMT